MTEQPGSHPAGVHKPARAGEADLATIRLFTGLTVETRQTIARAGRIQIFDRGAFLFFEGEPAIEAHFLLTGQVKIVHETVDGQEIILRLIQPGEIFGGTGGWGGASYPATAMALDDIRVFALPAEEFARLMTEHPELSLAVIRELAGRLREAEARIHELQVERVERRIARTLLRLAAKTGRETPDGPLIELPQSRQHLAELTGSTLTTVSRVLSEWDRRNLIRAGRERITITNAHELVMIAEDMTPPS